MLSTIARKLVAHYLKVRKNAGFSPSPVTANACPAVGSGLFWSYVARWLAGGNTNFHKGVNSNKLWANTVHGTANANKPPRYGQPAYVRDFSDKMFGATSPILVKYEVWSTLKRDPIKRMIRNETGSYKLSHAYISGGVRSRLPNGGAFQLSHSICAYIKNGEERIYDSNAPHSVAFNWVDNPNHVRDWYIHFYWRQPYAKGEGVGGSLLRRNISLQSLYGKMPWKESGVSYTLVYIKVVGNSNNINV
jgi:hypothetical protein